MTLLWLVTGASLLLAAVAWQRARSAARRVDQLTQMYWELKYQHGELRVKVQRLTGETPAGPAAAAEPERAPVGGFVPLSSLKR